MENTECGEIGSWATKFKFDLIAVGSDTSLRWIALVHEIKHVDVVTSHAMAVCVA